MARKVRLYADPSADGRVGVPADGELYEAEDAARLVGMGILTRKRPVKATRTAARPQATRPATSAPKRPPQAVATRQEA